MDRKKLIEPILYLVLLIALLAPRLPGLDSYTTLDEPYWLSMGANFYYALGQREFQNTVYEYQPAVTTMWVVTAGMLAYFPEYRGFGQGYLDYNKGWMDGFLTDHAKSPLTLLVFSRVIQVFVIAILFLILYSLLQRFVPKPVAAFVIMFASFDPFFMGQSRMLDHEAMLSLFVMISLLSLTIYLAKERRIGFLVLSGVAAGIAQITKSSAIAILLPAGVLFLTQILQERGDGFWKAVLNNAKILAFWLVLLVGAYILFWPGMWVAPKKMLYEVYGNAFSYAFQGARLTVTGDLETSRFSLETNGAGILSLIEVIVRRTTPLTWLGVLFGFAIPFTRSDDWAGVRGRLFTLLWMTPIAFIVMFGIARGRNSPHYLLCCYLALNILAGLGWLYVLKQISNRFAARSQQFQYAGFAVLAILQLWSAVSFYPYYYTYENPILAHYKRDASFPLFPYGEGLEFAGQYLASLPDAKNSTALVYYSRGSFSYYYPGITTGFKPYYIDGVHADDLLHAIKSANYLVVYYAMQGQPGKYRPYINALSGAKPIHEVWIDGRKYVIIYKVDEIPQSVFDALAKLPSAPQ